MAELGMVGLESELLEMLEHDAGDVRLETLKTLKAVGTLASIETLLPLATGVLNNPERREAASRAIEAIQDRHGGGERGGLAVSEQALSVEGGLSVEAERYAGELTLDGD